MTEIFTNAPVAYDYDYVQTVEVRRTNNGEEVRKVQIAIGCDELFQRHQRPRYESGLYFASIDAPDGWGELEVTQ